MYELALVKPDWKEVGKGFIPKARIITESGALYNAIGIMGATVMPHNIYLHSSLIMVRALLWPCIGVQLGGISGQ